MSWNQDPEVWEAMDTLMLDVWPILKDFIDKISAYRDEIDPTLWALLAPGLGGLVHSYTEARHETNPPQLALAVAIAKTGKHSAIQKMMRNSMNAGVDKIVEGME